MSAIGGPIQEIAIKGRNFAVDGEGESNRKLGGFETEVKPNGNKTARLILTAIAWSITGLPVEIDDTNGDQEFLVDVVEGKEFVPCTVSYASGVTYAGSGMVTETDGANSKNATMTLSLMGEGKLEKQ